MLTAKNLNPQSSIVKATPDPVATLPSAERAVQFLQEMYHDIEGFVSVVAIEPDSDTITAARTLATTAVSKLTGFVEQSNGKHNLYFTLNPLRIAKKSKAKKSDVRDLAFLHVDVDPRDPHHPLASERTRILAAIKQCLVMPSAVIDSGSGYWCLWRLKVPIPITDNIGELEQYNRRLQAYFVADHCSNIDRLVRLPYTWNLPDKLKRAKGRKKAVAKLIDINDAAYDLTDFDWLPPVPVPVTAAKTPVVPGEIPDRFEELLTHDPKLKARWEGNTAGLKDTSRSGLDMALAGMLWERERDFTKEEIAAILLAFPHGKAKEGGQAYIDITLSKLDHHAVAHEVEHCTDLGNARRLVHLHGHDIRYLHAYKRWIIWCGERWNADENEAVVRLAKQTVRTIYAEAATHSDDTNRQRLAKWAAQSESADRLGKMVQLAKSEPGVPIGPNDLDADPWLLGAINGTVNLRTGELREPRPRDYISKQIPVSYDPDAECPEFLAFLHEIMGDNTELVEFLQRAVGYSLTGDTSEQCLFILHGTGANGKSTFLNVIRSLLGDYALQCQPETLMVKRDRGIPNDIARLRGARFVATSETQEGRRFAEALVKQLTGGDAVVARFLYGEEFEFTPTFKVWLAANHKPVIRGDDHAIWRRIRLVPFGVTIPPEKRDRHLADRLTAELPGILRWAVTGCIQWQFLEGLQEPHDVLAATESYKEEMDNMKEWLDSCCLIIANGKCRAQAGYVSYRDWALASGEQFVMPQKTFSQKLKARGFVREEDTDGYYYRGIELLGSQPVHGG